MTDTHDVIAALARDGGTPRHDARRRFILPLVVVTLLSGVVMLLLLGEPFRAVAWHGPGPMVGKWAFSLSLLLGAGFALYALGQPGKPVGLRIAVLALPFLAVAMLLAIELAQGGVLEPGLTWRRCLAAMTLLGPIGFAAAVAAVRWLAPTDLRLGGLAAGLFGGAMAMTAYAPFCPERGMAYMALFYCAPMLVLAALGWLMGPRLLRW